MTCHPDGHLSSFVIRLLRTLFGLSGTIPALGLASLLQQLLVVSASALWHSTPGSPVNREAGSQTEIFNHLTIHYQLWRLPSVGFLIYHT